MEIQNGNYLFGSGQRMLYLNHISFSGLGKVGYNLFFL